MAESLDDGEFWLPPQFLSDDDVLVSGSDPTPKHRDSLRFQADAAFRKGGFFSVDPPFGGFESLGGSCDLSSPSTETESEDEELVAGLTRQMGRSTIGNSFGRSQPSFASDNTKEARSHTGSPQSTLCAVGSGVMSRQGSNVGSPNGPRQVSSPPATWDLLYAAAGEVARMRMKNEDQIGFNKRSTGFMAPPRKQSHAAVPGNTPKPDARLNPQQSLYHQRLQAAKFHLLKQQQLLRQQRQQQPQRVEQMKGTGHFEPQQVVVQNRPRNSGFIGGGGRSCGPLGFVPSARPPQQQNVSAMRAVFLGAKRESAGTGVFLPLRNVGGAASDKRKKPACPVLLPARVVQALNLNLDEMGPQAQVLPRFSGSCTAENDGHVRLPSRPLEHPQRRGNNSVQPQPGRKQEVRLPQEWIY